MKNLFLVLGLRHTVPVHHPFCLLCSLTSMDHHRFHQTIFGFFFLFLRKENNTKNKHHLGTSRSCSGLFWILLHIMNSPYTKKQRRGIDDPVSIVTLCPCLCFLTIWQLMNMINENAQDIFAEHSDLSQNQSSDTDFRYACCSKIGWIYYFHVIPQIYFLILLFTLVFQINE